VTAKSGKIGGRGLQGLQLAFCTGFDIVDPHGAGPGRTAYECAIQGLPTDSRHWNENELRRERGRSDKMLLRLGRWLRDGGRELRCMIATFSQDAGKGSISVSPK
jgi:hypothetical protein